MNIRTFAAASAALGILAAAGSANAAVVVSHAIAPEADNLMSASGGQVILYDFDSIADANLSWSGSAILAGPGPIAGSAPPPYTGFPSGEDETNYGSVQSNQTGKLTVADGFYLSSFSFYMGSPDDYNHLRFFSNGVELAHFQGTEIWDDAFYNAAPDQMGDREWGYRIYYDFGGAQVDEVTFFSDGNDAFEVDGFAGNIAAVPEPTTWALMIMGFGGAGAMIRRRKAALA